MPNKISQFWQELKRRNVIKVIAMYAGGAFVLFDLVNNVVEPLNLPDWTPRLIIIAALVGFPITVILSWIFDIASDGLTRTESSEELKSQEAKTSSSKRGLKVSDVIIAVLIILVCILLYPRVLGRPGLNTMTFPVTVVNEYGEKETRRVVKEKYITKLALFPFTNESNDSTLNWMRFGIMDAIEEDNLQFPNLLVEWNSADNLSQQIDFASKSNLNYIFTGTYRKDNGNYSVTTKLYRVTNGILLNERKFEGENFFALIDSICDQVRDDIKIPELILNSTPDLPASTLITNNEDAYQYYIKGKYYWHFDHLLMLTSLREAIEIDPSFASAFLWMAYWNYVFEISHLTAESNIAKAMEYRSRLSENNDIQTRMLYYLIRGDNERVLELANYQYKLKPFDSYLLNRLWRVYGRLSKFDKMYEASLKMIELFPDHSRYTIRHAESCLYNGKPKEGHKILSELLMEHPEHLEALRLMGLTYLHMNDLEAAEQEFRKVMLLMPEKEEQWIKVIQHINWRKKVENRKKALKPLLGVYRNSFSETQTTTLLFYDQLFAKRENQTGVFQYPISDTVAVAVFMDEDMFNFVEWTYVKNNTKKVVKCLSEQWDGPNYYSFIDWKEDSLILIGKDLLDKGSNNEALTAFYEAYDQNPDHYYLANYIQHLELILNPDYELLKSLLASYVGHYGDMSFHSEDYRFYYTDNEDLTYELLPLSQDKFMVPSKYELQVQIMQDKETVNGLKFLHRDGREEFIGITDQSMAGG